MHSFFEPINSFGQDFSNFYQNLFISPKVSFFSTRRQLPERSEQETVLWESRNVTEQKIRPYHQLPSVTRVFTAIAGTRTLISSNNKVKSINKCMKTTTITTTTTTTTTTTLQKINLANTSTAFFLDPFPWNCPLLKLLMAVCSWLPVWAGFLRCAIYFISILLCRII